MKKYLIALDMDGTLLNNENQICPKTKEYLKKLKDDGHIIVIASGRPIRTIQMYYDELGLNTPIICYNGASILCPRDPNFPCKDFAFPKETIKAIYNELKGKYIDNIMCETNDSIWMVDKDPTLENFFWTKKMNVIDGDLNETLKSDPFTMIIRTVDTKYNENIKAVVEKYPELRLRIWSGVHKLYSEVFYNHVTKASGIEYVAKHYNIPHEDIIAIGDANNDIEMFALAGISIAMVNGDEATKKHAQIISEFDNDHDGIAIELMKIIK